MVDSSDEKIDRRFYVAPTAHANLLYARRTAGEDVSTGATSSFKLLE
jgi:hypothetical protein